MKLWLVRHALTDAAPGLCYGATDVTVPANATRDVALQVSPQIPPNVVLRTSPLRRCDELAQAIEAKRADLRGETDVRLAEMDFGAWEGQRWSSIPRPQFDAWTADFADARPGGHGESTRAFMHRVGMAFDDWQASGADAVWITHAGVIRAVQLLHRGVRSVSSASEWPATPIGYGECMVIEGR
jgi:alpha-ribazole phosphatase